MRQAGRKRSINRRTDLHPTPTVWECGAVKRERTFAAALLAWRRGRKMTRPQAGVVLGVSWRTLESWERGFRRPGGIVRGEILRRVEANA